jgi:hypothetical protein
MALVGLDELAQVICQAHYNGIIVVLHDLTLFVHSLMLFDVLARYESFVKCRVRYPEILQACL